MFKRTSVVAIGTLGGTITMTSNQGAAGVSSTLGAEDLAQSIPGLADLNIKLTLKTLANLASGSIRFETLFNALRWAKQQVEDGADGVVLVQGTDTLEESAFLMHLYWPYPQPLVLTGAMRSPSEAGADGPANLLAAIQTAASPAMQNYGALVVMGDEVHQARYVKKLHTTSVGAFASPIIGPVAYLQENQLIVYRLPSPNRFVFDIPDQFTAQTLLIETTLDESVALYQAIPDLGYQGLVIAGYGGGHVSEKVRDVLTPIVAKMPVIMASRTGAGSTTKAVYGYKGGEIDLQAMGIMMAGGLCPRKTRLLLNALLWSGATRLEIQQRVKQFGEG
ncbi:asparaginase [Pelistega sp. MC2]|uniref:asparaginase n=1 Tax=Pelistega sp. MC2 TaxID=1720297 RepID=UPI0008D8E2C1|nr:asparaginase [Pelistega sp. MC2]